MTQRMREHMKNLFSVVLIVGSTAVLGDTTQEMLADAEGQNRIGRSIAAEISTTIPSDKLLFLAQCQLRSRFATEMVRVDPDNVNVLSEELVRAECEELTNQIIENYGWLRRLDKSRS